MTKKINWAQVDKRIRGRRPSWTKDELEALEAGLNKLPDVADQSEIIDIAQPGVANSQSDDADEEEGSN